MGVDVFFVISGFLISTIILRDTTNNTFKFTDFYVRRINRIFPAVLIVLTASLIFGWIALLPEEYQQIGRHIATGAGFAANFTLWNEAGYFDRAAELKPLLHLWSLGIEEQFYILWPLLLWFWAKTRISVLPFIAVLTISSFVWNVKGVVTSPVATFYSPLTRMWELLFGGCLAWQTLSMQRQLWRQVCFTDGGNRNWFPHFKQSLERQRNVLNNLQSLLGGLLVVYPVCSFNKGMHFPGSLALVPVFGACLVISAGTQGWLNRTLLSSRILVWFGAMSFPLYLWHWPLLSFARILEFDVANIEVRISVVFISILLAWVTYIWIETPIRFRRNDRMVTAGLIAGMILVGSAGFGIYAKDGVPARLLDKNKNIIEIFSDPLPSVKNYECSEVIPELANITFDLGCKLSKNTEPEILFLGDSHVTHYKNAVWSEFFNSSVLMVAHTSCLPFSTQILLNEACKKRFDAITNYIKTNKSIKKIYISGSWNYLMSGGYDKTGQNWRLAKSPSPQEIASFLHNGQNFLALSLMAEKNVTFMLDIPILNFDIKSCYDIRPLNLHRSSAKNCNLTYLDYKPIISTQKRILTDLLSKYPRIRIFDPTSLFCNEDICHQGDTRLPYYYNGDHVNWYGATMVIQAVTKIESSSK